MELIKLLISKNVFSSFQTTDVEYLKAVNADCVYLLLKDEHRISRNARAAWYLQNLNKVIKWPVTPSQVDGESGLGVLGVLASEKLVFGLPSHFRVTPHTRLLCLAQHYRLVFVLDISPSAASIDIPGGKLLYMEAFANLQSTLRALVKPFNVEDSSVKLSPILHITVIAHTPLINCQSNQVLIQGCVVNTENVDAVLDEVFRGLENLENRVAESLVPLLQHFNENLNKEEPITFGLYDDVGSESRDSQDGAVPMASPDMAFVNMLRYAILALHMLPDHSASGIVVITDGLVALPDPSLYDSLMTQLRHNSITCSFILTGSEFHQHMGFGHVPHTELLQFIAKATHGTYFPKMPVFDILELAGSEMNVIHKALLTWSFQKPHKSHHKKASSLSEHNADLYSSISEGDLVSMLHESVVPLIKKRHNEKSLPLDAKQLVSCRLREGYTIKHVTVKGQNQLEICMVLPWRDFAQVNYTITTAWPFSNVQRQSKTEVTVEGSYDFLHDITCSSKPIKSPFRQVQIRRYWQLIQGIANTDKLLVHLQSFSTKASYHTVPDALKQCLLPLFYLPANSDRPRLNSQLNAKDVAIEQFAGYWKPVLLMDMMIWQKWLHTHSLSLVLEHDTPLRGFLNMVSPSNEYEHVTCRQALVTVTECVQKYATLMLMENHSYVKFLYTNGEKEAPTSWCLIRLASKMPCLIVRLAFLGGTPGKQRLEVIQEIEKRLTGLLLRARTEKDKLVPKATDSDDVSTHLPPLQRPRACVPSCVLLAKPLEKILMRYEKVPQDFNKMEIAMDLSSGVSPQAYVNKLSTSSFTTLSRYLYHRRWVWSVQHRSCHMPISMLAISRILSNITKMRLQEGYHFAHTHLGMVNLMLQVQMEVPSDVTEDDVAEEDINTCPCLVQYIIFPPHTTTNRDSDEDMEGAEASTEADAELQVITECWIEPQYGQIINSTPERRHYDGITYMQLPQAMFPVDLECISTMITFEHLNLMCHSKTVPSPILQSFNEAESLNCLRFASPTPSLPSPHLPAMTEDSPIQEVGFPFDLLRIIPKCQQVELIFATLLQDLNQVDLSVSAMLDDPDPKATANQLLFSLFLDYLNHVHDREMHLSNEECDAFVKMIDNRERDTETNPLPFNYLKQPEEHNQHIPANNLQHMSSSRRGSLDSVLSQCSSASHSSGKNTANVSKRPSSQSFLQNSMRSQSNLHSLPGALPGNESGSGLGIESSGGPLRGQQSASFATLSMLQSSFNRSLTLSPHAHSPCDERRERLSSTGGISMQTETPVNATTESAIPHEDTVQDLVPKWRCFIKALTSTHVMLTFVPASYQYLLLLSEGHSGLNDLSLSQQEAKKMKEKQQDEAIIPETNNTTKEKRSARGSSSSCEPINEESMVSPRSTSSKIEEVEEPASSQDGSEVISAGRPEKSLQNISADVADEKVGHPQKMEPVKDLSKELFIDTDNIEKSEPRSALGRRSLTEPLIKTSGLEMKTTESVSQTDALSLDSLVTHAKESGETLNKTDGNFPSKATSTATLPGSSTTLPTEQEEETENSSQDPCKNERAVNLPVYVYNCPLSFLTEQLVNKWTYKRPNDFFEDLRFPEMEAEVTHESVRTDGGVSETEEAGRRRRRKTLSDGERRRISEQMSDSVYGGHEDLKKHCTMVSETFFRSFVNCVFRSVQLGLCVGGQDIEAAVNCICEESLPIEIDITKFLMTSCGHTRQVMERAHQIKLMNEDRRKTFLSQAPIDSLEESHVIKSESDVHKSGSDAHKSESDVHKSESDVHKSENDTGKSDTEPPRSGSEGHLFELNGKNAQKTEIGMQKSDSKVAINFVSGCPITPEENKQQFFQIGDSDAASGHPTATDSPLTPGDSKWSETPLPSLDACVPHDTCVSMDTTAPQDACTRFPLKLLDMCTCCESKSARDLHKLIKDKFARTLATRFKQVPTCPDILIFSPPADQLSSQSVLFDETEETSTHDVTFNQSGDIEPGNLRWDLESDSSSREDDDLSMQDEFSSKPFPLFVHPVCTVRHKGLMLKSIPARDIPTCLGELKECFEDQGLDIDLNDVQITLDLICLTLPPEADLAETTNRPCYTRMTSFGGHVSHRSTSSMSDTEDYISIPAAIDYGSKIEEHLGLLPLRHQQAIARCQANIEWLLRDEYVSLMRLMTPVSADALHSVAMHVQASQELMTSCVGDSATVPSVCGDKENSHSQCLYCKVKLLYVHGEAQSHDHFVERFERLNVPKFHINREGRYYYVCCDKTQFMTSTAGVGTSLSSNQVPPPHVITDRLAALTQFQSPGGSGGATPLGCQIQGSTSTVVGSNITSSNVIQPPAARTQSNDEDQLVFDSSHFQDSSCEGGGAADREQQERNRPASNSTPQKPGGVSKPSKLSSIPGSPEKTLKRQAAIEDHPSTTENTETSDVPKVADQGFTARKNLTSVFTGNESERKGVITKESHETQTDPITEDMLTPVRKKKDKIHISLTRPSPVRELAPLQLDMKAVDTERNIPKGQNTLSPDGSKTKREIVREFDKAGAATRSERESEAASHVSGEMLRQVSDEVFEQQHSPSALSANSRSGSAELIPANISKMDAISKTVHFLQHQSPDTRCGILDPTQLQKQLQHEKAAESARKGKQASAKATSPDSQPLVSPPIIPVSSSVSTVTPAGVDLHIRRTHSSTSFEKFRASDGELPRTVSARRSASTPSRSRHQSGKSGLMTPISSVFDVSSRSSYGEEGYEGDSSDPEDGTSMLSYGEARLLKPILPDFWLIMRVERDSVHVFFHARGGESENDNKEGLELYENIIEHIADVCHKVNQLMLLEDLYKTRMCNRLLVPEADEDVRWKPANKKRFMQASDSEDSDVDGAPDSYLAAGMQMEDGYFACPQVWHMHFPLHPRLKAHRHGISIGISSMRTVLQNISVTNRSQMFVYKEQNTSHVFYLRLLEGSNISSIPRLSETPATLRLTDEDNSMARSASQICMTKQSTFDDEKARPGDVELKDGGGEESGADNLSMSSQFTGLSASVRANKPEQSVNLIAYGICDVGVEISRDLVAALQKKLDDAVLELMRDLLTRNRMCKLMCQDIQFIQLPGTQPTATIYLTIPQSVMRQQHALGYYLRQNLLEFLFKPNYSSADERFRDYTAPDLPPIPESDVFLFNRPQQHGNKGLACIHLLFVDGGGQPLKLLVCPKPSARSCEVLDEQRYESLVHTAEHHLNEDNPALGPLVKFNIYERGDVGIDQLKARLRKALQYALCDVITEYRQLTAPLCEVPQHYSRGFDSPLHSAPVSPKLHPNGESTSKAAKKQEVHHAQDPYLNKVKSAFSFQSIVTDLFRPSSSVGTNSKDIPKPEGQDGAAEEHIQSKVSMYELGERGNLHEVFSKSLSKWFNYCHKSGCATVQKCSLTLSNWFSLHYTMTELHKIVNELTPDTSMRVFRCPIIQRHSPCDGACVYELYQVGGEKQSAQPTKEKSSSEQDLTHCLPGSGTSCPPMVNPCAPGRNAHYMIVGRNIQQWRDSLDESTNQENTEPQMRKVSKSLERFRAMDGQKALADMSPSKQFNGVPRQRFLMVNIGSKTLTMFAYNWAGDVWSSLEKQLTSTVLWHNARSHLLTCMVSQKLGLFQHCHLITEDPSQTSNPYLHQQNCDIDNLVKYTSPPTAPIQQTVGGRSRTGSGSARMTPTSLRLTPGGAMTGGSGSAGGAGGGGPSLLTLAPGFDELYRNTKPSKPLHESKYCSMRDPIHKHGAQMLELKTAKTQRYEKLCTLQTLYLTWEQRGQAHMPITSDQLELLKTSSRLVHNVATPLLFNPTWRQRILGNNAAKLHPVVANLAKERARHGSGSSVRSRRSNSMGEKTESPDGATSRQRDQHSGDEQWHVEVTHQFVNEYIDYVVDLGFTKVTLQPSTAQARRSGSFNLPRMDSRQESVDRNKSSDVTYLQRTKNGGIILIALGFQDAHFFVHVHALDCTKIPHEYVRVPQLRKYINPVLAARFTDDCDVLKDLTHVHSFAHDFHLRMLYAYLEHVPNKLPVGYHVTSFLKDFVRHYTHIPHFSVNYILDGALRVDGTCVPGGQLFEYITKHQTHINLTPLHMCTQPDEDIMTDTDKEVALMRLFESEVEIVKEGAEPKVQKYRMALIVMHDPPAENKTTETEKSCVHLRYWLVMIHGTVMFPYHKRLSKMGVIQSTMTQYPMSRSCKNESGYEQLSAAAPSSPRSLAKQPQRRQLCRHQGNLCRLNAPPTHQTPVYEVLLKQSDLARDELFDMVQLTMTQCRRDSLWQAMWQHSTEEPSSGRRRHRSGRTKHSSQEEDKPHACTFSNFSQLLSMVTCVPLNDVDRQLLRLQNMSLAWYTSLQRALINKFKDCYRLYVSADQHVQYLVIVNHSCPDTFFLLSIDHIANKGQVSIVFKSDTNEDASSPDSAIPPDSFFKPARIRKQASEDRMTSSEGHVHFATRETYSVPRDVCLESGANLRVDKTMPNKYDTSSGKHDDSFVDPRDHTFRRELNNEQKEMLRQFVNLCCYHLWASMLI